MILGSRKGRVSDTVRVTPDGLIVVDVQKLMSKPHVKNMIREIRQKTRVVRAKRLARSAKSDL